MKPRLRTSDIHSFIQPASIDLIKAIVLWEIDMTVKMDENCVYILKESGEFLQDAWVMGDKYQRLHRFNKIQFVQ